MASDINTSLQLNAPFILDNRYLNNGVPWASVAEVLASAEVQEAYRAKGLPVLVGKREYWFKEGTTDADLVPKGGPDTVVLTNVDGSYGVLQEELIDMIVAITTSSSVINFKAGSTAGAFNLIGSDVAPQALTVTDPNLFPVAIYGGNATPTLVYFSGVAGTGATVVLKIFKR